MSSLSDYAEAAILNHVFRNTALTSPTTVYLALYTVAPTDAGGGTEVTGGGYARNACAFDAPVGNTISNTAEETWTASGAAYGTVVAVGVFDAITGGNLLAWDNFTGLVINDGDTIRFVAGAIDISLD